LSEDLNLLKPRWVKISYDVQMDRYFFLSCLWRRRSFGELL